MFTHQQFLVASHIFSQYRMPQKLGCVPSVQNQVKERTSTGMLIFNRFPTLPASLQK
jgi:hypothetical protein